MSLKSRMLLLAIAPLILVAIAISFISVNQARELTDQQLATYKEKLLASKRNELHNYMGLALTSIEHLLYQPNPDKERIRQILRTLTYGKDSYFFVYDQNGTNLVHPRLPALEGQNLFDYRDSNGTPVIQDLLKVSQEGGFHRYLWEKPSRGEQAEKLSYVVKLAPLDWMLGTGLYIDDIEADIEAARSSAEQQISETFQAVVLLVSLAIVAIVITVVLINIRSTVKTNERVRTLAQRYIQWQLDLRHRFAQEIKEEISPRLQMSHSVLQDYLSKTPDNRLHAIYSPLEDAQQRLDQIAQQLRPSPLDEQGLKSALLQLINQARDLTPLSLRQKIRLPEQRLPGTIENTLYRITEEAFANIAHHANASQVRFDIWPENQSICLELEDNGQGFYAEEAGSGLTNIRERTELLGGSFELISKPGHGTLIKATLPINNPDA